MRHITRILYRHCDCGGDLHLLGILGRLAWYRCRHCGMQYSRHVGLKDS